MKKLKNQKPENLLVMPDITKKKKNERGKYLKKRLNDLFDLIETWLEGKEIKIKKISISIDDIKVPAAEIFSNNKFVASLKLAGLWGFGVNIQIDIVSGEETNFIFDSSNESSPPDWELVYSSGKEPKKLTKILFINLLKRLKEEK